jgi:hypothetical protein
MKDSARGGFKSKCFDVVFVFLLFATWITFTELTIAKNRFASSGDTSWQFGQVQSVTVPIVPRL